ncbi:hypothetical protein HanRHA438_Chr14g0660961 [Helianthus annuus]|nr:hypothetical protein HanRHA438_Chr14g0660961 [Helianthus annuus]
MTTQFHATGLSRCLQLLSLNRKNGYRARAVGRDDRRKPAAVVMAVSGDDGGCRRLQRL